jgi:hypothetical protein
MRTRTLRLIGSACALCVAACNGLDASDVTGAPPAQGIPSPPGQAPPTGSKWEGVEVEGECGGMTLAWVLVDEICGGTADPDYLDAFHAPIFRDGAIVGSTLFTADASYLWALDASDPAKLGRQGMVAGVGQPLALASRGQDLLVAAGGEGLLVLDGADPASPARKAAVTLPGPALDVQVEGDLAYVAVGGAGLAIVDLAATPPALLQTIPIPGFAAAVKARDGLAYVAACDVFAIVDPALGAVVSTTWLNAPYDGEVLVAPAKDVELVGGVAFVAAGRFGAVAVDVSDPQAPKVIGNCTVEDDLSFYASGVAAADGRLYVAGGEWGILPIDVADPAGACSFLSSPSLPPPPPEAGECSSEPPWEVLPWQEQWAPPPPMPGKDPIHVLPASGLVYAFGDATRIGLRAVDVRIGDFALDKIGRYEEPRLFTGISAVNDRVLVVGPAGGLYLRDEAALLVPAADEVILAAEAVAGVLLEDGRWALATGSQELHIEGAAAPMALPEPVWPNGLATFGTEVLVPTSTGALIVHDDASPEAISSNRTAMMPPALAASADGLFLASPEWLDSLRLTDAPTPLSPHGVFDADDIMNASLWRTGLPRRLLAAAPAGVIEIATLADRAGLVLHLHGDEPRGIPLPSGTYVGAAAAGDAIHLVAADRGTYRSQLVTVHLGDGWPAIAGIESFTGMASGVAAAGDRLYVADADRGIRVYSIAGETPELLGVVAPEVSP